MDILTRASDLVARDFGLGGNGAHIVIPSIIGPLLAAALVFNRLFWRIHLVRTLGIDDLCIGLSLVSRRIMPASTSWETKVTNQLTLQLLCQIFLFALAVVNLVAVNHGYGRPSDSLHQDDLQLALQVGLDPKMTWFCKTSSLTTPNSHRCSTWTKSSTNSQ
jgi:hypothetical protein